MKKDTKSEAAILRQKAEELLKRNSSKSTAPINEAEMQRLIHELEVHQIELEMQNEELMSVFSERERAEESLKASESRYRRLFESAKDGILILDAETGMIADVNPFLIEMLGYSADQFMNKAIWEIGLFKDIVSNHEKFLELQQKDYVRYDDLPLETADGRKISVEFVSNVYLVDNKKVIQCNIRDITTRIKTETALRISETHLRTLVKSIPDLIWLKDLDGVYLSCNPAFERFFGAKETDIIGKTDYDFVDRELADSFLENDRKVMAAGKTTSNEEWVTFVDDGHCAFLETIKTPLLDSDGKLIGVLGTGRDITGRMEVESKLREALVEAQLFSLALDHVSAHIYMKDTHFNYTYANKQTLGLFGCSAKELIGCNDSRFFPASTVTRLREVDTRVLLGVETAEEIDIVDFEGVRRVYWEIKAPIYTDSECTTVWGLLGISTDITERKLTEEKLRESEERFRAIFDQAPIAVALIDMQGHPIISNLPLSKMLGYSSNELTKMKFTEFTYSDDIDKDMIQFTDMLAGKISGYTMEKRYIHKNGDLIWANLFVTTLSDNNGKPKEIIGMVENITEKKLVETNLRNSEERFKVLFDYAPDAYFLTDLKGTIIDGNIAAVKIMGYDKNELIGKSFFKLKLISPHQFLKAASLLAKNILGQATGPDEFVLNTKKGSKITVEISTYPVKIQDQNIVLGIARDITVRKNSEKEIAMLAHSLKSINECVSITDLDNKIIFVNESFLKTYGYEINELLGNNIDMVRSQSNDQLKVDEILPATIHGDWQGELLNRRKDGSEFPIYLSTTIIKDKDSQPLGLIGVAKDISERKRYEETLLKLSSAIEQTVDSIMITDSTGTIEYVNHAFEALTGYSTEEVLGKTPRILKSGTEDQEYYKRLWEKILSGEVFKEEVVNKKKNGDLYYEEKTISPIFDKNRNITHFVGTGVDISERKRAEAALLESEELYRSLFENMLNGFAYCKMIFEHERPNDFIYLAVNTSFEVLTGLKDVVGKKISEVVPGIKESDPDLFDLYIRVALTGNPETREIYVEALKMWLSISVYSPVKEYFVVVFDVITKRKDAEKVLYQSEAKFRNLINSLPDPVLVVDSKGRIFYCNENALKTFDYNIDELLRRTMEDLIPKHFRKQHITFRNEYISEPKSRAMGEGKELFAQRRGGSEFPTEILLEPVEINGNQFTLAIIRDITARKRAETELIEAKNKAEESDRLKSAFLANMSHEVRTPLNSIIGFSELLVDPYFENEQKDEFIQLIISNGNSLLAIISDIMDISKLESGEITIRKSQINARKFMSDVKEQFAIQTNDKKLEFKIIYPENTDEIVVIADTERLRQIFNNLMSNAIKFTMLGSIEIGYQPKDTMVEFFVRDTGIGIPKEYHNTIFERFRQVEAGNSRKYGGNGLGLAILKNLVELMGGKIWLESESGKGSAFYFTLPIYKSELSSV